MFFNIFILAAIGGIAYFHYAQGFFSAFFSTIIAILAAAVAVSYHEPLAMALLGGKMADYANSITLVAIFAGVYIILRVLIDKAVPGNIRLPVAVDRVGGAALGVVAGLFAGGIFALAGAAMPFGPGVYPRYALEDRPEVTLPIIPGQRTASNADINEQLTENTFTEDNHKNLWIPADDFVLAVVSAMSDGGSMAGSVPLKSVHPNYADELFAQRLGIQVGAMHTAMNMAGRSAQVSVPEPGVFKIDVDLAKGKLPVQDAEFDTLHQRAITDVKPPLDNPSANFPLVVRVKFEQNAADSDRLVRLAPASVRLCAGEKNYYPVGTWESGKLFANKVDDFLILNLQKEDRAADFVFLVDPSDVVEGDAKAKTQKVKDGVFVEVKRLARVDLAGREVPTGVPASKDVQVERKVGIGKKKGDTGSGASEGSAEQPSGGPPAPFNFVKAEPNKMLFTGINTPGADKDMKNQTIKSGTFSMQSRQFTQLDINTTETIAMLARGDNVVQELFEPAGKKLVQVQGTPPAEGGDPWAWGALRNYQLVDAANKTYPPAGAWAKVRKDQQDRMIAKYNALGTPQDVTGGADDGRPTDVWIGFLVPSGTHLKQLKVNGKAVADLDQQVP